MLQASIKYRNTLKNDYEFGLMFESKPHHPNL